MEANQPCTTRPPDLADSEFFFQHLRKRKLHLKNKIKSGIDLLLDFANYSFIMLVVLQEIPGDSVTRLARKKKTNYLCLAIEHLYLLRKSSPRSSSVLKNNPYEQCTREFFKSQEPLFWNFFSSLVRSSSSSKSSSSQGSPAALPTLSYFHVSAQYKVNFG